jgi:phage N-6-adenine-methyltransferase
MGDYISSELTHDDKNSWSTPDWLFAAINNEFDFKLDAAANNINTKCNSYINIEKNALIMDNWADATPLFDTLAFKSVWINPPYSRGMIQLFMDKAYQQCRQNKITVVLIVPSTADAGWWPEKATEIRFITQGRISFQHPITKKIINGNTKGSALIVFKYSDLDSPTVTRYITRKKLKEVGQSILNSNPSLIPSIF